MPLAMSLVGKKEGLEPGRHQNLPPEGGTWVWRHAGLQAASPLCSWCFPKREKLFVLVEQPKQAGYC